MHKFTCALIGSPGSGKTSFVKRLKTGEYVKEHHPTKKLQVYKLDFDTTYGMVHFFVWDTSHMDDLYFLTLNCAIIFVDANAELPYTEIINTQFAMWHRKCFVPPVVCRNKVDLRPKSSTEWDIFYRTANDLTMYDISVKKSLNCELPFLWLCRKFLRDPFLLFKTQIAVDPPYAPIDIVQVTHHILEARSTPQPPYEDDW